MNTPNLRTFLLQIPVVFSSFMIVLGLIISFVPGAERGWFLVAAGLAVPGLFQPRRTSRIAAMVLLVLALALAFLGHQRALDHENLRDAEEEPSGQTG